MSEPPLRNRIPLTEEQENKLHDWAYEALTWAFDHERLDKEAFEQCALHLVDDVLGEAEAALRAGGQPPSDGMPSDRGKLREIADIIGDAMHGWVEMSQTDGGYEIIHVDDKAKGLEVFAALTVVWPKVLEVLRAAERGVSAVPPNHEE